MRKLHLILVSTASAVALQTASAEHKSQWYISLAGGANFADLQKDSTSEYGGGWAAIGALGYKFDNRLRLEAEVGYRFNDGDARDLLAPASRMEQELSALTLMGNALFQIPMGEKVNFALGAGAGAAQIRLDVNAPLTPDSEDKNAAFAWQLLAQADFAISRRTEFFVDYRFLQTVNDLSLRPYSTAPYGSRSMQYEAHTLSAGLRCTLKGNIAQAFFAVGCALAFAVTVKLPGTFALGSGKHLLESYLFDATVDPGWRDIAARILGPLFSFSAGGAGGIFAPSLASGAAVGGWIAQWFEPSRGEFNVLVLAGMTAFLTGVSRSPFTSAILVLEMTDRHSVIFQLKYAAMVAYLISHGIDKRSYYERMKLRLLAALPGNSGREPVGDRPARNGSKRPPEHDPHDEEPPSPTPGYGQG